MTKAVRTSQRFIVTPAQQPCMPSHYNDTKNNNNNSNNNVTQIIALSPYSSSSKPVHLRLTLRMHQGSIRLSLNTRKRIQLKDSHHLEEALDLEPSE